MTVGFKPLTEMLEKEWDAQLFSRQARNPGLAVRLGWEGYHTLRSRGSAPGFPDWTIWKAERHVFAELKRELTGKAEDANRRPKPAQVKILDGLSRGGAEVYLWRPSDLDEIARILGSPWRLVPYLDPSRVSLDYDFADYDNGRLPHLIRQTGDGAWIPKSIWIPGKGRADEAGLA